MREFLAGWKKIRNFAVVNSGQIWLLATTRKNAKIAIDFSMRGDSLCENEISQIARLPVSAP